MFHVEHQKQKTMDKEKIIKAAKARLGNYPTEWYEVLDDRVLAYIMEEVWKVCAQKGLRVLDWKEEVLKIVGYHKYIFNEPLLDQFVLEKVHNQGCFIYDKEMYIDDQSSNEE